MASVTVMMLDNTFCSQNQDYLPSRFALQTEAARLVVLRVMEADHENLLGIIPLAQGASKALLTPTKTKAFVREFIDKLDLEPTVMCGTALRQIDLALQHPNLTTRNLIIFLSSPDVSGEELLSNLFMMASKGVGIKVVCFGDALEMGAILKKEIDLSDFSCLCLDNDDNFIDRVMEFLGASMDINDPELEEAIRRSLQ
ncbi:26S proteasome regulatory subunit N10 [Pancytospora philotis]|nr:26S proteasome regulatory subunit N10 [Pancytospora philotis]